MPAILVCASRTGATQNATAAPKLNRITTARNRLEFLMLFSIGIKVCPTWAARPLVAALRPSIYDLFIQNLHQVLGAFFRMHQRKLGHGSFLQLRIFFRARNGDEG